jgi:hypothetical protein
LYVDFVPTVADISEPETLPDILVVHRDGTVRRISGDLQEVRWVAASVPKPDESALPPEVVSAHWVSYVDASTALLRRRDDILKECAAPGSSFLVLVYRDGDHQVSGLRFGVFGLPATLRSSFTFGSSGQRLRLLLSNRIPDSKRWNLAANPQIDFHAPSARLSISARNELINYDLSAYAPDVSSQLVFDEGHSSIFPLTSTLAAGALRSDIQIYDTNYQSIKARFELNTKSRRRGPEDSARKTVRFISYFARINVLVAVRGRSLLTFNLPRQKGKKGISSPAGNLLIHSLGRSTYASTRITVQDQAEFGPGFSKALFVPNQLEIAGWEARQQILDEMVKQDRVEEFERLMAEELQETLADEEHRIENPALTLPGDEQFVRFDKIQYLLSKIFCISDNQPPLIDGEKGLNAVIAFFPPRLLRWLAQHNHLSTFEIERALSNEYLQVQVKLGAIPHSIMEHDLSLSLLMDYLLGGNVPGLDEALTVIKMLINDAVAMAQVRSPSEQLLLEDSEKMALDQPDVHEKDIPGSESQRAVDAGGWSRECTIAINRTLEILDGFSPFKVISALRAHLHKEEALALIQFLRQQLFQSGNTSSFPNMPLVAEGTVLSLEITVSVLSSCIDALGPLGFLGSAPEQGLWPGIVPDLKTEVSLALAGIEEATYLKGLLQEMVRYGDAATSTAVLPSDSSLQQLGKQETGAGTIVSVYAKPVEEQGHGLPEQSALLPLSFNVENGVSKTKKRKGGGEIIERSGRELQYLKSRNIGRYSFEKLIL